MSLSDLAALGSFISGFAVLISLIFLYFQLRQVNAQVRQTERNQRALMNQGIISRGVSLGAFASQPHVNSVMTRVVSGEADFTAAEISLLSHAMRSMLLNLQDAHVQHKSGLADNITLENAINMAKTTMSHPIYRAIWNRTRQSYAPDMRQLVDQILEQSAVAKPVDLVAQLKSDLAEVMR